MIVLAGDIGGTKCRLCFFSDSDTGLTPLSGEVFVSRKLQSPTETIRAFLRERSGLRPDAMCLGVAGPVTAGKATLTNLPWSLDEAALSDALGIARVRLLNDLQAAALGMLQLKEQQFAALKDDPRWSGAWPPPAKIAVIAPGTGLGEALLYWDGQRHHAISTEGGHADFAPRNAEEDALLAFLRTEHGDHVSYERVLSGPGLVSLYRFLNQSRQGPEPAWLTERLAGEDAAAAISDGALEHADPICRRAIDMFASLLGAEAGNLVLKFLAEGGAVIGGGIAPAILPVLATPAFSGAFVQKGRFTGWLRSLPARVSLDPRAALIGAAHHAAEIL
ncbi:MAG: glucokinase [Alphaproteobacteria bacterium]|nr:glucokinase [Alphaproteobacteria bacterium]